MLHHGQPVLPCSKHIAVWRCVKFKGAGSSNQTTASLSSTRTAFLNSNAISKSCNFGAVSNPKPIGTAKLTAEWEKPSNKLCKHAALYNSQTKIRYLPHLAYMSNLGSYLDKISPKGQAVK